MFIYILESEREKEREKRGDYKASTATASSQEKEEGATETNKQTSWWRRISIISQIYMRM
jgi:hypothetical protein